MKRFNFYVMVADSLGVSVVGNVLYLTEIAKGAIAQNVYVMQRSRLKMDREMMALIKTSKNTNQSKHKQLQRNFDEYVKKNDVKVSVINGLRKENKELIAKLEYEQYIYSEELGWSNDVVQLLIQCEPLVKDVDVELHEKIKQIINAASV